MILVSSESKVLPCSHEGNETIERRTAEEEFADAWLEVEERFFSGLSTTLLLDSNRLSCIF